MKNIRKEAAQTLVKIRSENGYAPLIVDAALKTMDDSSEQDKRLYTTLVYTTLAHRNSLDQMIAKVSKTPLEKLDPLVLASIELGACQMMYLDGIKPYAAVNESVGILRRYKNGAFAGYANAILRRLSKTDRPTDRTIDLPRPIKASFEKDYGKEEAAMLQKAFGTQRRLCIRMNTLKASKEEILSALTERFSKENVFQGKLVEEAVYLRRPGDIGKEPLFLEGYITVQDESSMLAAALLGSKPGETILDMCAAPGGKSAVMAAQMKDEGTIVSCDIHPHRIVLILDNAKRLGINSITAKLKDAMVLDETEKERYDRILVDAPCSGLGILRSKPDIAFHHTEDDWKQLESMQSRMLDNAAAMLKAGGELVYSTCTLRRNENDDQVKAFLKRHPEMEAVDISKLITLDPSESRIEIGLTLWPAENSHEGFYMCRLHKKA